MHHTYTTNMTLIGTDQVLVGGGGGEREKGGFSVHFTYHRALTYLLSPWSRVLLEKLTGSQLVKEFPVFDGT
jgi:hypothetical protein